MRKRTIIIDDGLLKEAQRILGTQTVEDTVNRALTEVISADARRALIRRFANQDGLDLGDEELMRQAWKS